MYKYKILIEGYARAGADGKYYASPTTTLVYDESVKVLVDPGANKSLLLERMEKEKLKADDITYIFLSHYHPDHFLNLRLFPNAVVLDGSMIWDDDSEEEYADVLPDTNIKVISTPGHALEHASLSFDDQENQIVFICQDVFWWEDGKQDVSSKEALMKNPDPFMVDWDLLQKSRELVLSTADIIIPGHGKLFKNTFKDN
jgi:glyoxylase-like metal-dependent hydrolase (beta-lactamase superfamily II)